MRTELATAALGVAAVACGAPGAPSSTSLPNTQSPPQPAGPALDAAALDAWVERELEGRLPSAVIAIADRGGVRWHRAVGARDARGGAPPDRSTVYRIGSITKVLTGTAVLQLRDAGTLTLDDPLARWIPELAALGAGGPPITIRHLVTHTAGIPTLGDGSAEYWKQTPPDRAQLIRAAGGAPLLFPPGSHSEYSNAGMALVGEIVARASGMPYRAYLAARVLGPLGMRTAVWDREAVPAERLAIGVGEGGAVDPPQWQLGAFEPAGGLYASLDDMAGLARLALGGAPEVLAAASLDEALRDDPLPGPHGVAWAAGTEGELRHASHTGSTMDYSASIIVLPDRGLAAIVLAAGPGFELTECAAVAVLRSAVTGEPPASCRREPAALGELAPEIRAAADAAAVQLRAVLAAGTPAAVEAAFAPGFLKSVPASVIAEHVAVLARSAGRCDRHELLGAGTRLPARGVLHCERAAVTFEIAGEAAPPHRITGLLFPGS